MAQKNKVTIVWTHPALSDLDAIADYIALDNFDAAAGLVRKIFSGVERVRDFPAMGRRVPELAGSSYREILVSPCRILYRVEDHKVFVVLVMRSEQLLEEHRLWR